MSAYQDIVDRYGRPDVQVFAEDHYRVILWEWHIHRGASHGQLSGDGSSLHNACVKLLAAADAPAAKVARGSCDCRCLRSYEASAAAEVARAEFLTFLSGRPA